MKMKIVTALCLIAVIGISVFKITGHLRNNEEINEIASVPVTVKEIETSMSQSSFVYQGIISPANTEQISFKSSARLESFNGEVGQIIQKGEILVTLDKGDLQLAVDAAQNELMAAKANYQRALKGARKEDIEMSSIAVQKAKDAVDYLIQKVEEITVLYSEGIVSKSDFDSISFDLALAQSDLALAQTNLEKATNGTEIEVIQAAKAQVGLADINLDAKKSLMEDVTYTLVENQILIEKFYEPGELVPAGYPVALLRSEALRVKVGVAGKDLDKIFIGQKALLSSDLKKVDGEVIRIAEIPDSTHFLYEVEISMMENTFKVGQIVNCEILLGFLDVVLVPLSAIMNDGIDYIYIYSEGIATIRKVTIKDVIEGYAIVDGLKLGDLMITSNLNRIHEQSKIHIEE